MNANTGPLPPGADGPGIDAPAAPHPSATILAGLLIDHDLSLDWLPAVVASLPSAAALEQGIRAEYARMKAQAS
jgi:hypothetical protein